MDQKVVDHIGFSNAAASIEGAVTKAIKAGEAPQELGGDLSTTEAGEAVIGRLD